MMFIKHGTPEPIRYVTEAPEVIEESAKEALEKAKKSAQEENLIYKITEADLKG